MTPLEVLIDVRAEFGEHIAALVLSINVINRTMKVKQDDLVVSGAFTVRLRRKVDKFLWEETSEDVDLAWRVAMKLHTYDCCKQLGRPGGGLGGCLPKTLKQLIEGA